MRRTPLHAAFAYTFSCTALALPMPPVTALLHTRNDALRLGRSLDTLRPCEEIMVIDHGSSDGTRRIAREYGAKVLDLKADASPDFYLQSARYDWILCLDPRESLTEGLEATLLEWRSMASPSATAYSVYIREETPAGWLNLPLPQTRLVPRTWKDWQTVLPADDRAAIALEGELLRFLLP